MAARMQRYFSSQKFRKDMTRVGSGTPPYGHATPTNELLKKVIASTEPKKPAPSSSR